MKNDINFTYLFGSPIWNYDITSIDKNICSHISSNIFDNHPWDQKRYCADVRLPTDTKDVLSIADTKDVRLQKNVIRRNSSVYVAMKLAKIFQFGWHLTLGLKLT